MIEYNTHLFIFEIGQFTNIFNSRLFVPVRHIFSLSLFTIVWLPKVANYSFITVIIWIYKQQLADSKASYTTLLNLYWTLCPVLDPTWQPPDFRLWYWHSRLKQPGHQRQQQSNVHGTSQWKAPLNQERKEPMGFFSELTRLGKL